MFNFEENGVNTTPIKHFSLFSNFTCSAGGMCCVLVKVVPVLQLLQVGWLSAIFTGR